ncbi:MAG: iron-sulfur cluster assembly scaffold protein [Rhodobacteraceae bacterium]|nr:iron-sulfur cluster assembly scaffold protein [Paracoccaceae bacterium]
MAGDTDLIKLYSRRILALAADIPHVGRLPQADASTTRRSPLCGSMITVDVKVENSRITAFGQNVKACALGQAAASVVGAQIIGRTEEDLRAARNQLRAMLAADGPTPAPPFEGLEVLRPARDYKNRHASIMLALEAALEAMQKAEQVAEQTRLRPDA